MSMSKNNEENLVKKDEKRIDFCEKIYSQVNSWIENADNKVSVSCGILTGVFAVVAFLAERVAKGNEVNICWHQLYKFSFCLSMLVMGIAILFYVFAINPNLGSISKSDSKEKEEKRFPLFFGDIAKMPVDEYKQLMKKSEEKDYLDELLVEIHYNSVICSKKMKRFRWGLWMSFAAIGIAAFSWVSHMLSFG